MRPREFEVVLLDAAGTLLELRGSVGEVYSSYARLCGIVTDPIEIEQSFHRSLGARPPLAFPGLAPERLEEAERQWWRELVDEVFDGRLPVRVREDFFSRVYRHFDHPDAWRLFPDTEECLRRLRGRYRLAVLSNFDSRLDGLLQAFGIAQYFEQIVLSSRCAAAKPDPRIFRHALDLMGVPAASALHIGDSPHQDFDGARAAGLGAILLDRGGRLAEEPSRPCIASLEELCRRLQV